MTASWYNRSVDRGRAECAPLRSCCSWRVPFIIKIKPVRCMGFPRWRVRFDWPRRRVISTFIYLFAEDVYTSRGARIELVFNPVPFGGFLCITKTSEGIRISPSKGNYSLYIHTWRVACAIKLSRGIWCCCFILLPSGGWTRKPSIIL